jgi:hypothetical protein
MSVFDETENLATRHATTPSREVSRANLKRGEVKLLRQLQLKKEPFRISRNGVFQPEHFLVLRLRKICRNHTNDERLG